MTADRGALSAGTRLDYTCWTNVDSPYRRGYEPGDRLVRGYSGTVAVQAARLDSNVEFLVLVAEVLFDRHNRDDRPDGHLSPSMSVGDVVTFPIFEAAVTVESLGFALVDLDPADLITDHYWSEVDG